MRGGGIRGRMVEKPIFLCGKEGVLWIRIPSQLYESVPTWSACQFLHSCPSICWSCALCDSIFTEFCHQRAHHSCYASDCGQRFLWGEKCPFALEVKRDDWNSVRLHWFLSTYSWMIREKTRGCRIYSVFYSFWMEERTVRLLVNGQNEAYFTYFEWK